MAESDTDQAAGAIAGSTPGSTRPNPPTGPTPLPSRFKDAQKPVREPEDGAGDLSKSDTNRDGTATSTGDMADAGGARPNPSTDTSQGGTARQGSTDNPTLEPDVTKPAGETGRAASDDGDPKPARAENDPLHGSSAETPSGTADPDAERRKRQAELDDREKAVKAREDAVQPKTATVSEQDIDAQIIGESFKHGADVFGGDGNLSDEAKKALGGLTICVLALRNGGIVMGSAESPTPETYDPSQGRVDAKADARQQLATMHRYAHRMKVAGI